MPNNNPAENCSLCYFGQSMRVIAGSTMRLCRRASPDPVPAVSIYTDLTDPSNHAQILASWPPVLDSDWCGDGIDLNTGRPFGRLISSALFSWTSVAGWKAAGATPTLESLIAPDGSTYVASLIESTSNEAHAAAQALTVPAGVYKAEAYVKFRERTRVMLGLRSSTDPATNGAGALFDLTNRLSPTQMEWGVGYTLRNLHGLSAVFTIDDVGAGWSLCRVGVNANNVANELFIGIDGSSAAQSANLTYQGDGVSGVYVWNASLSTV